MDEVDYLNLGCTAPNTPVWVEGGSGGCLPITWHGPVMQGVFGMIFDDDLMEGWIMDDAKKTSEYKNSLGIRWQGEVLSRFQGTLDPGRFAPGSQPRGVTVFAEKPLGPQINTG